MAIPISYNVRSLMQRPLSALGTALGMGLVVAVLIGALTQTTGNIRLGFGVTLLPFGFTHPARVAEKVATADVLSAALYARFRSRQSHTFAEKMLSAMRMKFGGHVEPSGGGRDPR